LSLRAKLDKKFLKTTLESLVKTINSVLSGKVDSDRDNRKCREFIHFTNECLALVPGIDGNEVQSFIKVRNCLSLKLCQFFEIMIYFDITG